MDVGQQTQPLLVNQHLAVGSVFSKGIARTVKDGDYCTLLYLNLILRTLDSGEY